MSWVQISEKGAERLLEICQEEPADDLVVRIAAAPG